MDLNHPLNKLLELAHAAGLFQPGGFAQALDRDYHQQLRHASQNALAGTNSAQHAGQGTNVLASPMLAKLQKGGMDPAVQAWFAQTAAGRSGFGSGASYGNKDLGQNF